MHHLSAKVPQENIHSGSGNRFSQCSVYTSAHSVALYKEHLFKRSWLKCVVLFLVPVISGIGELRSVNGQQQHTAPSCKTINKWNQQLGIAAFMVEDSCVPNKLRAVWKLPSKSQQIGFEN